MTSSAKLNEVGASFSRLKMGAISSTVFIMAARVTDGVKPSIAAKKNITAMLMTAASFLRRLHRNMTTPTISDTCIPETAMTWEMPVMESSLRTA